jgi:aspartate/methionine/tyrosine aminotransferase
LIDLFYVNHVTLSDRLGLRAFEHIDILTSRSQNLLNQNRPLLNKFLDERTDIKCVRPEFGTTVFPRLKNGDVNKLTELLITNYQTLITPGRFFDMPEHFRIGLSCTSDIFTEGLKRLGMAIDSMK